MSEVMVRIRVRKLKEGPYLATSPDLRGLIAQGRTFAEAIEIAADVARRLIDSYREHGDPLPPRLRRRMNKDIELALPVGIA